MGRVGSMIDDEIVVPQKSARIRVPRDKMFLATKEQLATLVLTRVNRGMSETTMWEDVDTGDKIIFIEGDHHIVEPFIHALMEIVLSNGVEDG